MRDVTTDFSAYNGGMRGQSEELIRELRARMAAESRTLKALENQFQHPYFKGQAQRAIKTCEEAEIMFLRPVERENWRDAHQEAQAIGYADAIFQLAVVQRKQLQEIMDKYGPAAVAVPYP